MSSFFSSKTWSTYQLNFEIFNIVEKRNFKIYTKLKWKTVGFMACQPCCQSFFQVIIWFQVTIPIS